MASVAVKGNFDMAWKKFTRQQAREGIPSEFKKRECYDKPGIRRREAKKAAIKNAQKKNRSSKGYRD